MSAVLHPKCGQRFPSGERAGHCGNCCRTFIGLAAYEAHLSRDDSGSYLHLDPAAAAPDAKWWADDAGNWHKGDRLTEAQKAEMWGVPA